MKRTYTRQEVFKLLDELADVAIEGIEYVGSANYPERQKEALYNLQKKFNELTRIQKRGKK